MSLSIMKCMNICFMLTKIFVLSLFCQMNNVLKDAKNDLANFMELLLKVEGTGIDQARQQRCLSQNDKCTDKFLTRLVKSQVRVAAWDALLVNVVGPAGETHFVARSPAPL